MTRLTRRYRFPASHRLHNPEMTEAANRRLYGKCNNPYGHGHDYVLEVSVIGPIDQHGRVADRAALDRVVDEAVLRDFRYANLNRDVPEFGVLVPTSENVAIVIQRRLDARWREAFPWGWPAIEKIRLLETRRNVVELLVPAFAGSAPARREELAKDGK